MLVAHLIRDKFSLDARKTTSASARDTAFVRYTYIDPMREFQGAPLSCQSTGDFPSVISEISRAHGRYGKIQIIMILVHSTCSSRAANYVRSIAEAIN